MNVTHWFDFVCPFCYVAQQRNDILRSAGLDVVELPFQIHPEIPPGGVIAPPRVGAMYDNLRREADAAGLPLTWSSRLVYSKPALELAESVRRCAPQHHQAVCSEIFDAYFGRGLDIEAPEVLQDCLNAVGAPLQWPPTDEDRAVGQAGLADSMRRGRGFGVNGTPAWLIGGELLAGLLPPRAYRDLAESAMR